MAADCSFMDSLRRIKPGARFDLNSTGLFFQCFLCLYCWIKVDYPGHHQGGPANYSVISSCHFGRARISDWPATPSAYILAMGYLSVSHPPNLQKEGPNSFWSLRRCDSRSWNYDLWRRLGIYPQTGRPACRGFPRTGPPYFVPKISACSFEPYSVPAAPVSTSRSCPKNFHSWYHTQQCSQLHYSWIVCWLLGIVHILHPQAQSQSGFSQE